MNIVSLIQKLVIHYMYAYQIDSILLPQADNSIVAPVSNKIF